MSSTSNLTTEESRLTFGVELEFLVLTVPPGQQDPEPQNPRVATGFDVPRDQQDYFDRNWIKESVEDDVWEEELAIPYYVRNHIRRTLISFGIPTLTSVQVQENLIPQGRNKLEYWIIDTDTSVELAATPDEMSKRYRGWAIEIKSPAYFYDTMAVEAVKQVCKILCGTYRTNVNESTGLHVHVGDSNKGFELATIRKLMSILWTFEAQFDTIHPDHRIDGMFCKSINTNSVLARRNLTRSAALDVILKTRSIDQLGSLVSDGSAIVGTSVDGMSDMAYNISGLTRNPRKPESTQPTVEFRQHKGTLEAESVAHWINLCVRLLEVSGNINADSLVALLKRHIDKSVQQYPLSAVLWRLDLGPQACHYGIRAIQVLRGDFDK